MRLIAEVVSLLSVLIPKAERAAIDLVETTNKEAAYGALANLV